MLGLFTQSISRLGCLLRSTDRAIGGALRGIDGEVVAAISSMDDLHTERLTLADEGFLG